MQTIRYKTIATPLGEMLACAIDEGLCSLEFIDERDGRREPESLSGTSNTEESGNRHLDDLETQLAEYFAGERKTFDIKLVIKGTEFQKKVWTALLDVPYGSVKSYKEQAEYAGCPKAVRAVAAANGSNRIVIVIPCHRIIGCNGELTGYGGGLHRKKYLLELEARFSNQEIQSKLFAD